MESNRQKEIEKLDFVDQINLMCWCAYKVSTYNKAVTSLLKKGTSVDTIMKSSLYKDREDHKECHDYLKRKLTVNN